MTSHRRRYDVSFTSCARWEATLPFHFCLSFQPESNFRKENSLPLVRILFSKEKIWYFNQAFQRKSVDILKKWWTSASRWAGVNISFLVHNSGTVRNILMVLGRNIGQVNAECRTQDWQLCLSSFSSYAPWSLFSLRFLPVSVAVCNCWKTWYRRISTFLSVKDFKSC